MKRIGILTVGGDAPGQNVCLKSLVYTAVERGYDVIGIRKGWEGLLSYDPENPDTHSANTMPLTKTRVRDIDRTPGSFLHSSRVEPDKMVDAPTQHVQAVIAKLNLDALIVLGDYAGLCYTAQLAQASLPVIGIPKTVHNNIPGSDYTLGFSTAVGRGVHFVNEIRAMAGSREEIAVIEILGHVTGLTTMLIAFLAGADHALIPEAPFDPEKLARLLANDKQNNPNNYAMLVLSEAAAVAPDKASQYLPELSRLANSRAVAEAAQKSGNGMTTDLILFELLQELGSRASGSGPVVTEMLENITGQRMLYQPLSYLIRTGEPDGQDLVCALNFALMAIQLVTTGQTGRWTAYRQRDHYADLPLDLVLQESAGVKLDEVYDADEYKVKPAIAWAARF